MTGERYDLGWASLDRRTFIRAGLAVVGGGIAAPWLASCAEPAGGGGNDSSGGKKVTLRFNWTAKGEFTPFFVAREKGYYEEVGLNVELLEGKSGTQAVQVVGTGDDDFGYIPSIQVVEGINQGMPIQTVATVGRYTGMCWASRSDVPLEGPDSLLGNRVSVSTSSTFAQVWEAFQKKYDLDQSEMEVVHPDPSARVALFLRNKLDIMADIFYANDYVIIESKADDDLNLLRMSDLDFDPLGYLLVANKSLIDSDPDLVRKMVRASLKGLRYTLDNPDDASAIMAELYGDRLGADVIAGQVKNMESLIIQDPALGQGTDAMWKGSLELLGDAGVTTSKKPLQAYYTNEFLS